MLDLAVSAPYATVYRAVTSRADTLPGHIIRRRPLSLHR
ncbi:hypothetical protein GLA29479_1346 [Lysobacter antibioticus]|uniref:Uncharacterized protein n=1 Tax=Lysobacter antibioticus TaxID=84531 RepID=A0A0S2DUM6_LYSAN|nr:hypothetical protein GLA29479_1346 [Lysobacter antibioticus]ALN78187.1 hypothetical protein LA76x_0025 [Lysobacter antibioticus]